MAIGDAYATAAEYRGVIGGTETSADTLILRQLKATSRYLERKLGQYFNKDASVTTRKYRADGTGIIEIEPVASTTGLLIAVDDSYDGDFTDETDLAAADFELWPLNADKGPEPRPWTELRATGWGARSYFDEGFYVQVTAIHGWPAVPDAIAMATIELTAMALRLEGPYATQVIQEMETVVNASPQARSILKGLYQVYNRYPVGIG